MSKGSGYVIAGSLCLIAGSLEYIGNCLGKKELIPGIVVPVAFVIALILIIKGWRMDKTT